MIDVDDIKGTVTMSLSDYEVIRDRESVSEQQLKVQWEEVRNTQRDYEKGLFKFKYPGMYGFSTYSKTGTQNDVIVEYDKYTREKFCKMSILDFIKYRKVWK